MSKKQTKQNSLKRIFFICLSIIVLIGIVLGYFMYLVFFSSNINPNIKKDNYIIIKTGSSVQDIAMTLTEKNIIMSQSTFNFAAKILNLNSNIHPGRYLIHPHGNNKYLIKLFKSGIQIPYKLSYTGIHTRYDFAGKISQQIEVDSSIIIKTMQSDSFCNKNNLDIENSLSYFIVDTSQYYYTTSTNEFINKMKSFHDNFWNEEHLLKAKSIGLTKAEVAILASIVEKETAKDSEKPIIAGLYLNRLKKKGWKLEADPTVIYAIGDYTKQRLYNNDLKVNSPYNTYKYAGLPPGPICMPTAESMYSVLNYTHHNYMYMCAKEDFSGYHNFAHTLEEHERNAARYYAELKRRNIH